MQRPSQSWLLFGLLLSFFLQPGLSLLFKDVPSPEFNPRTIQERRSADPDTFDVNLLNLLSRDSFFWTGTQNGHLALANFTIDLPGEDETIISMERFRHVLKSVECTADTMTLGFKNDKAFKYSKVAWAWLNDADPHKLVIVAGTGSCGWNAHRIPFSAASVIFDDKANTAKLIGAVVQWKEFQHYELTVGNYNPVSTGTTRRDIDKTLSMDFNHGLPFSSWKFPIPNTDISVTWGCSECGTTGSFDFGFHIKTSWGVPESASMTLSPNGVAAKMVPKIGVSGSLTDIIDDEVPVATIPVSGISIPGGILDIGPEIVFSIGYQIGPVSGAASISAGVEVSLSDSAELEIQLTSPDVSSSGWTPSVHTIPVAVDAKLSAAVQVYLKAQVQLTAEALGQGFEAGINLKPYLGGTLSVEESSGNVCNGQSGTFGVKITPDLGVSLNADIAKASSPDDPLAQAEIANWKATLADACWAFGPGGSSESIGASSSVYSPPVAPTPIPTSTPVLPPPNPYATTFISSTYTHPPASSSSVYAYRRHHTMKYY